MNIVEGLMFNEEELFEILRADFSIGREQSQNSTMKKLHLG